MSESEWSFNVRTQKGVINVVLLISTIIQTVLFVYHVRKHDAASKLPHMHEWLEHAGVVFFIVAIVLSEINLSWTAWMKFDTRLTAGSNGDYEYLIQWLGCCLLVLGNALFAWIEYFLDQGIQSPLFLNDVSIHNIAVSITSCDDERVSVQVAADNERDLNNKRYWSERELMVNGPYSCCRHPIYLIWATWEFGYLLCTGHWFEYTSFTLFILIEALRIDIIDRSLLYKYGQRYVDYVVRTPMAFFPTCIATYCCNISLAYCMCCCIECARFDAKFAAIKGQNAKAKGAKQTQKIVHLLVNEQAPVAKYDSCNQ